MIVTTWLAVVGGPVVVITLALVIRWVLVLHRRTDEHSERISHIEGQLSITKGKDDE